MSRVKKAHDLLFSQPFSPALFRQGPQPWSTLLRDVLRGTVPEADLERAALSAEKRTKKPVLLRDLRWKCATCEIDPEGDYKKFLSGEATGKDWYEEYKAKVIMPGCRRRCLVCAGGEPMARPLDCAFCGPLPLSAFTDAQRHHAPDSERRVLCRS